MKAAQFLALLFTALALVPVGAHLAALPNKIHLDQAQYFVVQGIYRGWALFGIAMIGAILTNAVAAFAVRRQRAPFLLAFASTLLLLATLAIFFAFTFPANQATFNWTQVPPDWVSLRWRWEISHAINAVLTLAAFCLLAASVLTSRD